MVETKREKNMENTLVSIIVPTYNCERYIEECIDSLLNQSYKNIEIIIIDDGSKDNTKALIKKYCEIDSRIVYYLNSNHGVSFSRNFGINKSNGEFLLFVDADDELVPNAIDRLLNFYNNNNNPDVIIFGYEKKYINKNIIQLENEIVDAKNIENGIICNSRIGGFVWNKLYKTSIVKQNKIYFKEDVHYNEDTIFNIQYLRYANKVAYLKEVLYHYRMRKTASSYNFFNKKNASILFSQDLLLRLLKDEKLLNLIEFKYLKSYYNNKNNLPENFVANKNILENEKKIVSKQSFLERIKFFFIKYLNFLFKRIFKLKFMLNKYYS